MVSRMEGEHLDTLERMVVSPAAGVFSVVADLVTTLVSAGTTIGFVRTGGVGMLASMNGDPVDEPAHAHHH